MYFHLAERHRPQAVQIGENRPGSSFRVSRPKLMCVMIGFTMCFVFVKSILVLGRGWELRLVTETTSILVVCMYLYLSLVTVHFWRLICVMIGFTLCFIFQELEGKCRASDDCLQACNGTIQVVRTIVGIRRISQFPPFGKPTPHVLMTCLRWGLQNKVESFIQGTEKRIFTNFHREVKPSLSSSNQFGC